MKAPPVALCTLRRTIAIVANAKAALPSINCDDWSGLRVQHQHHRAACEALARKLAADVGARTGDLGADPVVVRIHGIRASSTSGFEQALANWLAAASRQLRRREAEGAE